MRVGGSRRLIKCYVPGGEDLRELLESLRSARTVIIFHDVRMVPLLKLQNLCHIGQDADAPLLRGRKHRVSCDIRQKAAKLKYPNARRIFNDDTPLRVIHQETVSVVLGRAE
jgi:hypothetical protein